MAKQTINLGTSANKGDGDPLRTAFDKVNDNFDEVYSLLGEGDTDDIIAPMLVHNDHTNITVTRDDNNDKIIFSVDQAVTDIQGSVFADDSTLLVDGAAGKIVGDVDATTVTAGSVYSSYFLADGTNGASATFAAAQNISGAGGSVFITPGVGTTTDGKIILGGTVDTNTIQTSSGNLSITADNYVYIDSENGGQVNIGRASGLGDVLLGNTANGTDVQLFGRLAVKGGGVPTSSVGATDDFEGLFAVDNSYIYYCTDTYDGATNIWKRVAWSGDTW